MKPYNQIQQQKKIRKKALVGKIITLGLAGVVALSSIGGVEIKAFAATLEPAAQTSGDNATGSLKPTPTVKTYSDFIGGTYSGFIGDTVQDLINYLSDGASNVEISDPNSTTALSPSVPLQNGVVYHAVSSQGETNIIVNLAPKPKPVPTMKTGWAKINNNWYYFNIKGKMVTGWVKWKNNWYYLNSNGAMATGWVKSGKDWFYLDPSTGIMKTGWVKISGKWYYLYSNGKMAHDTKIGNYKLGHTGAML